MKTADSLLSNRLGRVLAPRCTCHASRGAWQTVGEYKKLCMTIQVGVACTKIPSDQLLIPLPFRNGIDFLLAALAASIAEGVEQCGAQNVTEG